MPKRCGIILFFFFFCSNGLEVIMRSQLLCVICVKQVGRAKIKHSQIGVRLRMRLISEIINMCLMTDKYDGRLIWIDLQRNFLSDFSLVQHKTDYKKSIVAPHLFSQELRNKTCVTQQTVRIMINHFLFQITDCMNNNSKGKNIYNISTRKHI